MFRSVFVKFIFMKKIERKKVIDFTLVSSNRRTIDLSNSRIKEDKNQPKCLTFKMQEVTMQSLEAMPNPGHLQSKRSLVQNALVEDISFSKTQRGAEFNLEDNSVEQDLELGRRPPV